MVRLEKWVGGVYVSVGGDNMIEAFQQMSMVEDCFEACPIDGAGDFKLRVREVEKDGDNFTYYELYEPKTKARLSLGQYKEKSKSGFLFPKRKDKDGKWMNNRGWEIWDKGATSSETIAEKKPQAKQGAKKATSEVPF